MGERGRLLPDEGVMDLAAHLDLHGPPPFSDGRAGAVSLIDEVDRAGLTGRGGAGFPSGRKLRAVAEAGRRAGPLHSQVGTIVVGNGAESEPASRKDRELLSRSPHLVLDGIVLAAEAVGATRTYLCVHTGALAGPLREAVVSRERSGLNRVPIQVVEVPGGYVSSQETALLSLINGGRAVPTFVPPLPAVRGAHKRPTLVQNVETLANIALIARYGADWYRQAGDADAPGTALITVSGAVTSPGVYEVDLGSPLTDLLSLAGGPAADPQAVLAGGYFGGWLPMQALPGLRLSQPSLRRAGASLGPGVIVLLPAAACPLAETAHAVAYLAGQSAGQCGPCKFGLPVLAECMQRIAFGRPGPDLLGSVDQVVGLVAGRGACHLPDSAAGLAAGTLTVFEAEVRRHAEQGPCPRVNHPPVLPAAELVTA
jgi:NADH:ubiquinone oxidoreductase subunit F (NADH-binding)